MPHLDAASSLVAQGPQQLLLVLLHLAVALLPQRSLPALLAVAAQQLRATLLGH